jgi:hypothetical protein
MIAGVAASSAFAPAPAVWMHGPSCRADNKSLFCEASYPMIVAQGYYPDD